MRKIIVIEDDVSIRGQVCFSLEKKYEVSEASSMFDVLADDDVMLYDIAVVDLGLPPSPDTVEEGLKVIEHLLEHSCAKIIVLTGQDTEEAATECLKRGCFDFLTKPVMMDKLLFSLERAELFLDTERTLQKTGVEKVEFQVQMGDGLQKLRECAEKNIIMKVLKDTGFNVYKSAKILGVKRESLYYFIKKFNLVRKNDD
ncbi:MAG: response regulator [Deferribacterales bacterium]